MVRHQIPASTGPGTPSRDLNLHLSVPISSGRHEFCLVIHRSLNGWELSMTFKDNLLKKISIDRNAAQVMASLKRVADIPKIDKAAMHRLLELSPYNTCRHERDLDLHLKYRGPDVDKILVLDNELTIYNTTVEDVVLRKSPTIKEMLSIRNAIKILNDSDVVISKKEDSVQTIQKECLAGLDLAYADDDIEAIRMDGERSFQIGDDEGVRECLALFAELLGFTPAPKSFQTDRHQILGALNREADGKIFFGPMVIYSSGMHTIKLLDEALAPSVAEDREHLQRVVSGAQKASVEGTEVFQYLKAAVLKKPA